MSLKKTLLLASVVLLPASAHAASFKDFTASLVELVNDSVIPLLYAFAFLFFLVGMVRFFFFGGEEHRQKGKQFMLWGVIGFVVLFSVWGIVRLFLTAIPGAGA
ncbi:pilin [Patescibacteria group bacterium]|nr:pilin [Patescibacteria group bacterium]MBU2158763.1 pilin [Patescibacteria group bacterium]MBU2220732.1 pilin [Patescibacteria group bacterium]